MLTDLDTGIVGSLGLVVASVGTIVKTTEKLVHIGCVHTHTAYEIVLQTLRLEHTHGIGQGVHIVLQVCFWSRVAATGKGNGHDSQNGYN